MAPHVLIRIKGIIMVTAAAILWGISGTVAQYLFQVNHISVDWLVTVRLIISGILLLTLAILSSKNKKEILLAFSSKRSSIHFLIFGIVGMLGVQYTYFASIDLGNAAVATLLQYLAPIFVVGYLTLKLRTLPTRYDYLAIALALAGTFLLLTNGDIKIISVPTSAIVWGILSGIALAFYTLYSKKLVENWGSLMVTGWGMVIGGIGLGAVHPPFYQSFESWTTLTILFIIFVIIFGTLLPFYLFVASMKHISAKEATLFACIEPLTAVFASILWLKVPLGMYQIIGTFMIVTMVIVLSYKPDQTELKSKKLEMNQKVVV